MTEIKIPFTKNNIKRITKNVPDNVKVLEVEISTDYKISDFLGQDPATLPSHPAPDNTLDWFQFVLCDGAESQMETDLLSNKTNFELNFDKEKITLSCDGGGDFIDPAKPEVHLSQSNRFVEWKIKPKSVGIIKLTESGQTPPVPSPQPGPGTPPPPPNNSTLIQLTKKSAEKVDLSKIQESDPEAQGVELSVESFSLNAPKEGMKTFDKIVVVDNHNKNVEKLNFLLEPANKNIQINFLSNARIGKFKTGMFLRKEQNNVAWNDEDPKKLVIYLNDVFGFKPDQISFQKLDEPPSPNPLPGDPPPQKNPSPTDHKDVKITHLKARIKELEEKLRQQPNSLSSQDDQKQLNKLKNELKELEKSDNQQPNKDQFPYLLVFGITGGAIVFLIIVFILVQHSRNKKNN